MARPATNLLIDSLPEELQKRLLRNMEPVGLPLRMTLGEVGVTPRYAYFVTSGMVSSVLPMADGMATEVAVTGSEGMTGWESLLGRTKPTVEVFTQIEGTALRIPLADLRRVFEAEASLRASVLQFVQQQVMSLRQLAACNRMHTIEQRFARWLLMVQERVGTEKLQLTQEFLSQMLGSRRTSVALTAGKLQRDGVLTYHRGNITILDEPALEKVSCECYEVMRGLLRKQ